MYEYICLKCGEKIFSSVAFAKLDNVRCEECGGITFYSCNEIYKHLNDNGWLKRLKNEYNQLEKLIRGEKKKGLKTEYNINSIKSLLEPILKGQEKGQD